MTDSILATKLYRPPVRPGFVPRPRLSARLSAGLARKLTLISAQAGFGKTTLLSDWAAASERPVAWLSLDEADNDPVRFWSYVVAGLQTLQRNHGSQIRRGLGQTALAMLRSTRPPTIEVVLTDLINEMAEPVVPAVLVLEDYHLISAGAIHSAMLFFLENLPPQVHLILSTRKDPPWPLARLRARGQISEIRAADLRFTRDETARFFNDIMGMDLSLDDIAALDNRTEGWIAGLQLAALSLRNRSDVAAAIKEFSGSHRFILDYLVEEVLRRQTETTQSFLLKTSILERLCGDLCDALLQPESGPAQPGSALPQAQAILEELEQANLFVVPLDDERRWYRYHRLFADLLQSRLLQSLPGETAALHSRASVWFEENGLIADAIGHALAGGDVERVARLVEGNAIAAVYHGELASLAGWLAALPEDLVRTRPWLLVAHAWILALSGRFEDVEACLQNAEEALVHGQPAAEIDTRHLSGHLLALRTYLAALRADLSTGTELARAAMRYLPAEDKLARGYIAMLLGSFLRWDGDLAGATKTWTTMAARGRTAHDAVDTVFALNALASVQIEQGQLHRAAATCRDALQLAGELAHRAGRPIPFLGVIYARLSTLAREWNDLDGALDHARQAVALSTHWGQAEGLVTTYLVLAEVYQSLGNRAGVEEAMRRATQTAAALSDWYRELLSALQAQLWVNEGACAAARRWLQQSGLGVKDNVIFLRNQEYRVFARVSILCADKDVTGAAPRPAAVADILGLLDRLLALVEQAGATGIVIEILLLKALAQRIQGETDLALDSLAQALGLAEPEGYVRLFLDFGAPMKDLLRQAAARRISPAYVAALLDAFGESPDPVLGASHGLAQQNQPQLIEPLSDRELEVLRLLPAHLTSSEIAERLIVAPSTVRSHIKSIYAKLDVHSRSEALVRARELHLL